ncbi:MAG TPA: DNA polymerase III subunit gamma/tau [Acidobacteriaceae bacterium]|nr:DNA polymerase III subunit gamma/tau [Acidobacteriaceae bacterium]
MAYQVLARKYRPLRFADVVGQDHVTRTLLNALAQDRIAHGYIFSGHRGIGKTTIARILASALNCQNTIGSELRPTPEPCLQCNSCLEIRTGNAVDVLEIDAATNRGIDEIRELRDAARYRPARDRFKIIILDEAHQITDAAFNALLKTLEEPPEHIVFMMATTQPEDIPQTIRSRCQHFSFHAVKLDDIVGQLRKISDDENIAVDDTTLGLLAEAGDGSMRDALSIMDQAIASAPTTTDGRPHVELTEVRELMGAVSNVVFEEILQAVHNNDSTSVLHTVGHLLDLGNGPQQIARQFVRFLRNTVVAKITGLSPEADVEATGIAAELLQISAEERRRAARAAANFSEEELSRFLAIILRTFDDLGYRQEQRLHLELGLLKLVHVQRLVPIEEILSQLGATATPNAPKPPAPSAPRTPQTTSPQAARTAAPRTTAPLTAPFPRPQAPPPAIPPVPKIPQLVGPPPARTGGDRVPQRPGESTKPGAPFNRGADEWASQQPSNLNRPKIGSEDLASQAWTSLQPNDPEPPQAANAAPPVTTDGKASPQPEPPQLIVQPAPTSDASHLQTTVVRALLNTKGQTSAAEQLEDANWTFTGNTLTIQTTLSKTMLPVVFNAEADRILKATLRDIHPAPLTVQLLPGAPITQGPPKKSRAAAAGSAAELAEKHPLVQEAKRLFSADISNVIDLRKE